MNNYFQTASPFPNPDATQEFRVITNNFDAQYGYTAGAIVSIATRSGTNQWHGAAFEFLRNNVLNSKEYFTQQANPLKRNQFGGSLGGPIIKDKLFVFGNLQFTRERVSASSSGSKVPTTDEIGGNFGAICTNGFDANGVCMDRSGCATGATPSATCLVQDQVYTAWNLRDTTNPADYYPKNVAPTSALSPFALNLVKGLPVTNTPGGAVNVLGIALNPNIYEFTLRTDYNISPTQTLSVHFFDDDYKRPNFAVTGNYLDGG
jgi:hypothetical protein